MTFNEQLLSYVSLIEVKISQIKSGFNRRESDYQIDVVEIIPADVIRALQERTFATCWQVTVVGDVGKTTIKLKDIKAQQLRFESKEFNNGNDA